MFMTMLSQAVLKKSDMNKALLACVEFYPVHSQMSYGLKA